MILPHRDFVIFIINQDKIMVNFYFLSRPQVLRNFNYPLVLSVVVNLFLYLYLCPQADCDNKLIHVFLFGMACIGIHTNLFYCLEY